MAVYKIFASADATLYSKSPAKNTGLDEILEVGVENSDSPLNYFVDPVPQDSYLADNIKRALVLFSTSDLNVINTIVSGSWKSNLRLYLANAENLSTTYNLEVRQVSQSWIMGTGQSDDVPETRNGVCWYSTGSFATTASSWGNGGYYLTSGGGSWNNNFTTQSFGYKDNKDINIDVTSIVSTWVTGSQTNNGFIIKFPTAVENNMNSFINVSFFSVDTHTIYPPTLDIKWNDSTYSTGSLSAITSTNTVITLGNNLSEYKVGTGKYRMVVNARDKYPARTFTTSSFYTTNKALPQTSYWAIQDVNSNEMIIDFDTDYTKISCDGTNNYFNLYMNGLEPERFYKVLIKTVLSNGESVDIDNNLIFKVTR